jgi:hypothetical protein
MTRPPPIDITLPHPDGRQVDGTFLPICLVCGETIIYEPCEKRRQGRFIHVECIPREAEAMEAERVKEIREVARRITAAAAARYTDAAQPVSFGGDMQSNTAGPVTDVVVPNLTPFAASDLALIAEHGYEAAFVGKRFTNLSLVEKQGYITKVVELANNNPAVTSGTLADTKAGIPQAIGEFNQIVMAEIRALPGFDQDQYDTGWKSLPKNKDILQGVGVSSR